MALAVVPFLAAGAGAYFGSYLKKKGENLATHEDIDKLVDQVRAVTTTTKEIEAKISDDVWDRQKRWEMKRDALFEVVRALGLVNDALTKLQATYQTDKQSLAEGGPERPEKQIEVSSAWINAADGLERARLLTDLVCGDQVKLRLLEFSLFTRELAIEIRGGALRRLVKRGWNFQPN